MPATLIGFMTVVRPVAGKRQPRTAVRYITWQKGTECQEPFLHTADIQEAHTDPGIRKKNLSPCNGFSNLLNLKWFLWSMQNMPHFSSGWQSVVLGGAKPLNYQSLCECLGMYTMIRLQLHYLFSLCWHAFL